MANMGYCRFRNTLLDMRDLLDHWDDELDDDERHARKLLLELCCRIAADYGDEDE